MYTVSKGPNKIFAKTRRGLSQNLERLDSRKDQSRKSSESDNGEIINMPKPVFHSNGKKTVHQRIQHHVITPQHEEIIRYISEICPNQIFCRNMKNKIPLPIGTKSADCAICMEAWTQTAYGESEPTTPTSTIDSGSSSPTPPSNLYYQDDAPSPVLRDFKPFDLETWWGKRLFQNITNSL